MLKVALLAGALALAPFAARAQMLGGVIDEGPSAGAAACSGAPCLLMAVDSPTSSGSGASVTTTGGTAIACPAGSFVIVAEHVATNSVSGSMTDSQGNTYGNGNLVVVQGRLLFNSFKLTSPLPAGSNFTMAFTAATNANIVAGCFPNGTAFAETGNAGAAATSASPSLSTTSGLASSPQYVAFALFSNGQLAAATPNGSYVRLGGGGGGFGTALFWKKTAAAGDETFAPTGMTSVLWGLQVITGTTP